MTQRGQNCRLALIFEGPFELIVQVCEGKLILSFLLGGASDIAINVVAACLYYVRIKSTTIKVARQHIGITVEYPTGLH